MVVKKKKKNSFHQFKDKINTFFFYFIKENRIKEKKDVIKITLKWLNI
jgi:hypothetical protein